MALTNAERQERYRQRLKDRATAPGIMFREACLRWVDEVRAETMGETADEPDSIEMQRFEILGREIAGEADMDRVFLDVVNYHMEGRLHRTKVPRARARK